MPDPSLSLVAALLDRSGSMSSIAGDTRGGFDTFIDAERGHDGTTVVTLAQFDDQYAMVYESIPIDQVPPLYLVPRGMTALYDAVGKFVTEIGSSLAALPEEERPGSVTVLVMTDGQENSSREWSNQAVRQLIEQQESQYGWDFVFLGANMDAVDTGSQMGFKADKSLTYDASSVGVSAAFSAVVDYQDRKRAHGMQQVDGFSDGDRRRAGR
ncbi:VWA domain-containing protein [Rhodococcus sp. BP-316]|uniref:VWA domain-containing protein n=1 Tax=Rhodococcus sp. BP-316 TaxID=2739445 RepID=UPI001C9A66C7|nr:VWA domain-containing protein [Rhodococcus sp. BP-316]MBY6682310.1 VWA domain-containing protein [Rhodococcus sp. BP-316]